MIYLDSAATSLLKPESVKHEMLYALNSCASPGRGGHKPALDAAEIVYECRETAAEMFGLEDPMGVVFTMNATHALNIAVNTYVRPGMKVLVSGFEHNSVTRPLKARQARIKRAGTKLFDKEAAILDFEEKIKDVGLVVCTHVSNVFGFILPVEEIGRMCAEKGIPYIVDASQSAGILDVNVKALDADFVCMPGHKGLMGPQGTGLLLCREKALPLMQGGSGSDSIIQDMPDYLPERLEAGTHNVCGIAGLLAGMKYVREKGLDNIFRHENALAEYMINELKHEDIELFYSDFDTQCAVLSCRSPKINCEELAWWLGERGVCVRSGLHCAPYAHESAGTLESGTMRMSFSPFISKAHVKTAADIIKQIINNP